MWSRYKGYNVQALVSHTAFKYNCRAVKNKDRHQYHHMKHNIYKSFKMDAAVFLDQSAVKVLFVSDFFLLHTAYNVESILFCPHVG